MAVVQVPEAIWRRRGWVPPSRNQVNRSAWTGARKVLRLPGAGMWKVSAAVMPFSTEAQSWPWKAFFMVLEGEANTFLMPYGCQFVDPSAQGPAYTTRAGGAVQGASQFTVVVPGPAGLKLRGGQMISLATEGGKTQMLGLLQDLVTDANGTGVVKVRGTLRERVAGGNVAVELAKPVCEMAMASGDIGWDEEEGTYAPAFDAVEAF